MGSVFSSSSTSSSESQPVVDESLPPPEERAEKLPLFYSSAYNIGFMKMEELHPFDSRKYEKVHRGLIAAGRVLASQFSSAIAECTEETLLQVHTVAYLQSLKSSLTCARLIEVPPVAIMPAFLVNKHMLTPMRVATQGTIDACFAALCNGWALNVGGGFHHASATRGGGFCVYADISLAIVSLKKKYPRLSRVAVVDLDAHQGNGHETDKVNGVFDRHKVEVFIFDMYNGRIYPYDFLAKAAIDFDGVLKHHTDDADFLDILMDALPKALDSFRPQFVVYNAGTDILVGDPLGNLDVSEDGIVKRDEFVFEECLKRNIPIAMLQAGGYQKNNASVIVKSLVNLDSRFGLFTKRERSDWRSFFSAQMEQQRAGNGEAVISSTLPSKTSAELREVSASASDKEDIVMSSAVTMTTKTEEMQTEESEEKKVDSAMEDLLTDTQRMVLGKEEYTHDYAWLEEVEETGDATEEEEKQDSDAKL